MASIESQNDIDDEIEEESVFETIERLLNTPVLNSYAVVADILPRPSLIAHPVMYMGTLVRIGYEPMPPKLTKSIFGRTQLQLPGFFTYMKYITQIDGFWGCYRGLKYNIIYSIIYQFTSINVDRYQKANYYSELRTEDAKYIDTNHLARSIVCDSMTRIAALSVAYPFHLIMIRSMAQFIGRETYYDSLSGAISDIYETGGLIGFYAGFAPYVIGECVYIFLESSLMYALREKFEQLGIAKSNSSFITNTFVNVIARTLIYPFKVVSTVMACNGDNCRSLAASAYTAPEHPNWIECWQTLWTRGEIKRGSSIWWRYQPITSSLMFPMQPIVRMPDHLKGF
ncbi:mitochondrial carrier-like protein 2-like protein [Euroglyphus maynei]|uniref:Mitochondrial carrier-like protein 2-like protein n=1 Tax=Euroglyphus maynei TaxID=6958 RepID=A0A1Y3BDB0_EURMA|nr:mitochondrial carrier-like protein 2-like protein [Euroglyphus maynei]